MNHPMTEPHVDDALWLAYPGWYLPPVYALAWPESDRWDVLCPRIRVASESTARAWPPGMHVGLMCSRPPHSDKAMWADDAAVVTVIRQREDWSPDHWVTGAAGNDELPRQARCLAAALPSATTVSVVAADEVWMTLRTHTNGCGILMRITTDSGADRSPLTRGLYAPAVFRWYAQWHKQIGHRAVRDPLEKQPVPWPKAIELSSTDAAPARLRLHDITPLLLR
ncbi:hypothetical protein ABZX95_42265 [Streptomyces sp. NPDC004232]|uniref:hypothetical protein n=1 Tax=Streptomyces sp. NPDC004232 TaxID=3154454 RepID=UPI0033B86F8B